MTDPENDALTESIPLPVIRHAIASALMTQFHLIKRVDWHRYRYDMPNHVFAHCLSVCTQLVGMLESDRLPSIVAEVATWKDDATRPKAVLSLRGKPLPTPSNDGAPPAPSRRRTARSTA